MKDKKSYNFATRVLAASGDQTEFHRIRQSDFVRGSLWRRVQYLVLLVLPVDELTILWTLEERFYFRLTQQLV